jgi:hypothetical protein
LAVLYKPFYLETNTDPEILETLEKDQAPERETAPEEPPHEVILEQDGIHLINKQILSPGTAARKTLDPEFLNLVESVIRSED